MRLSIRRRPAKPATVADAERFTTTLAQQLDLPSDCAMPAYEDPAHFLLIEQKLPLNIDPADNKLDDPQERARVVKVFERGLGKPSGYVMPIQAWHSQERGRRWVTERWALRRGKLFLMPGDSPVGFRLPIGSMPYIAPDELSACHAHRSVPGPYAPAVPRGAAARPAEIGDAPAAGRGAGRSGRGLRHGAHGDGNRAARRPSLRVHAAA